MDRNIKSKLEEIFQDVLDLPELKLTREMSASDVPEWDSVSHINILAAVQDEFDVQFSVNDIGSLKTVGDLIDLIERKSR